MPKELLNLEVNDFGGGLGTDFAPLKHPPNKSTAEANFQITPDGTRRKRKGMEIRGDFVGAETLVASGRVKYRAQTSLKQVAPTPLPVFPDSRLDTTAWSTGNEIEFFGRVGNSTGDTVTQLVLMKSAAFSTSLLPPYVTTSHDSILVVGGVVSADSTLGASLAHEVYGAAITTTTPASFKYEGKSGRNLPMPISTCELGDMLGWDGRLVCVFNSLGDSGFGLGISQLYDPAATVAANLASMTHFQTVNNVGAGGELTAQDGVFLDLSDLPKVTRVYPYRKGLLLFTERGVWHLSSGAGTAVFNPYDFTLDRLGDTRLLAPDSVVGFDTQVFFWAESGIYGIAPDENTGLPKMVNITKELRVQTWYEKIPTSFKDAATGTARKATNQIRWLYTESPASNSGIPYYDREVVLDIRRGVVTLNSFSTGTGRILGYLDIRVTQTDIDETIVTVPGSPTPEAVYSAGDLVTLDVFDKYSVSSSSGYVIGEYTTDGVPVAVLTGTLTGDLPQDYVIRSGVTTNSTLAPVPYKAYLKTGLFNMGDTQRKKGANYLTVTCAHTEEDLNNFLPTTPSSCMVSCLWDYATGRDSNYVWGPYECYRPTRWRSPAVTSGGFGEIDYPQELVSTKMKLRGRGKAFQLLFESDENKLCELQAWGTNIEVLTRI